MALVQVYKVHTCMGAFQADTEKPTTLWSNHKDWLVNLARQLTPQDRERIRQGGKRLAESKDVAWLREFSILEKIISCKRFRQYIQPCLGSWEKVCHREQDQSDQFRAPRMILLTWQCSYLSSELNFACVCVCLCIRLAYTGRIPGPLQVLCWMLGPMDAQHGCTLNTCHRRGGAGRPGSEF